MYRLPPRDRAGNRARDLNVSFRLQSGSYVTVVSFEYPSYEGGQQLGRWLADLHGDNGIRDGPYSNNKKRLRHLSRQCAYRMLL